MTESERSEFDALAAEVKLLKRSLKLLTRDVEAKSYRPADAAPVVNVTYERPRPTSWEFEVDATGKTIARPAQ